MWLQRGARRDLVGHRASSLTTGPVFLKKVSEKLENPDLYQETWA